MFEARPDFLYRAGQVDGTCGPCLSEDMMIVRMWTASVATDRITDYERFAATESLAMFKSQPGNLGVLFTRRESTCTVVSLWDSNAAVEALTASPAYDLTVRRIVATGFIIGDATAVSWESHGGWVSPALLVAVEREQVLIDAGISATRPSAR
jgi:heme-degrading monooxygenase HmoA